MDLVSPILDIFTRLCDCTIKCIAPIRHIQENLQSLRDAKCDLEDISTSIENDVKQKEEKEHSMRTNEVKGWLGSVESVLIEVNDVLEKGEHEIHNNCLVDWCPRNCCFRYKLGKKVIKKVDAVKELERRGKLLGTLVGKLSPPTVVERLMEDTVGTEFTFSQLWTSFQDDSVRIIGVYGMGGVGKTTLLKKLNNKFVDENHEFDVVIWAVVSKEVNLRKIQEIIRKRVEISDEIWNQIDDEDDRATEIFKQLSGKKFVLLLDDLWDWIDLSKLGICLLDSQNKIKIVFTSRSEEVCDAMRATKFRVQCLSQQAAWELFRQNLGEDVLNSHRDIPKLAKIVLNECKGLPLALITIGRAMACRRKLEEWEHAIKALQSYPSKFSGMGDSVFHTLRFSYDSLPNDTLKNCFLYCSIFPDDHNIKEDELIELWIGERFLDEYDNIYDARNEGKYIIGSLKLACLLETGETDELGDDCVKMHDILRDMALWLASKNNSKILVQEHVQLSKAKSMVAKWKEATRISLWDANIESLTESPSCSNLLTLLVRDKDLERFPNNLFQSMCLLNVLDLSRNKNLIELPAEIGELVHLQYLNLSYTGIKMLPIEVKKLTRLRILRLDVSNLQTISAGVISCLSSLQVFRWFSPTDQALPIDVGLLHELESLEQISDISLMLSLVHSIDKFLYSPKLIACTASLRIRFPEDCHSDSVYIPLSSMKKLEYFHIIGCSSLKELMFSRLEDGERMINRSIMPNYLPSLRYLYLRRCPIKDLTWLRHVPSLSSLTIGNCPLLEQVMSCDFGSSEIEQAIDIFPNLKEMTLVDLPNLKSICRQAMPFPSLENLNIWDCPSLRKLPFNSDSAKSSCFNQICGSREWCQQLEWEDDASKRFFTSRFFALRGGMALRI